MEGQRKTISTQADLNRSNPRKKEGLQKGKNSEEMDAWGQRWWSKNLDSCCGTLNRKVRKAQAPPTRRGSMTSRLTPQIQHGTRTSNALLSTGSAGKGVSIKKIQPTKGGVLGPPQKITVRETSPPKVTIKKGTERDKPEISPPRLTIRGEAWARRRLRKQKKPGRKGEKRILRHAR